MVYLYVLKSFIFFAHPTGIFLNRRYLDCMLSPFTLFIHVFFVEIKKDKLPNHKYAGRKFKKSFNSIFR